VKFSTKHFTVVRVKAQLDQMIDGLNVLGVIYELIKANPHARHKLLVSKPVPMTSDFIMDLSNQDSLQRALTGGRMRSW